MSNELLNRVKTDWLGAPVRSQNEVAAALGISRDCVQGAEKRAFRKLRKRLAERLEYHNET